MFKQNLAVLHSASSRDAYVLQAERNGQTYEFLDARGHKRRWLKGEYAYLAPNATSAMLNRFSIKHDIISEEQLMGDGLEPYHTLFIPNAGHLPPEVITEIIQWSRGGENRLIVTGKTNLPLEVLGISSSKYAFAPGYTGWRWTSDSPFSPLDGWSEFYISGYKGYQVNRVKACPGARVLAKLLEFTGDLSSPLSVTTTELGDGIVVSQKSVYVANQVFEYLGGVMQAHINVEEVRMWSNPTHWGDTLAYFIQTILKLYGSSRLWATQLRAFGSYDGVLQLRHDTDHCPDEPIDLAMLDYEVDNVVPASYYVPDPSVSSTACTWMGCRTLVQETSKYGFIECALHNDSAEGDPPVNVIGEGLSRHISESDRRLGICSYTAGRHMGFLVYPETIDAMDYLYEHHPSFLGLCTFSLYDVIAYGQRNTGVIAGGKQVTYTTYDHKDPSRPAAISGFWFPYHVVVSTTDEHKTLRGWDTTHDTDCSYERLDALFEGQNATNARRDSRLLNGVFTIHYLANEGRRPSLHQGRGYLPYLRYAISKAERCNFWLASKKMLYERMNDFDHLQFRVESDGTILICNPTDRLIQGLMVSMERPVAGVTDGTLFYIHIVEGRLFTMPCLKAGQFVRLTAGFDQVAGVPAITQVNTNTLSIISATFDPASLRIDLTASAIRRNFVVVRNLPANRVFHVTVEDHRGTIHLHEGPTDDGTVVVSLFGPENDFCLVRLQMTMDGREESND